jgi:hypothetical protein
MSTALEFACGKSFPEAKVSKKVKGKREHCFDSLVFFFFFLSPSAPWQEYSNKEVPKIVKAGERLPQPEGCPFELFNLMLWCWEEEPDNRPSFRKLLDELTAFRESISVHHDEDHLPQFRTTN